MQLSQKYLHILRNYITWTWTNFESARSMIFQVLMYANWKKLVLIKNAFKSFENALVPSAEALP